MILGLVLWAAFLAGIIGTLAAVQDLRGVHGARRVRDVALWAAGGLATFGFLALLWLFVTADVRYETVFLYTHTDLPLRYRIAGTWAGQKGSLLLWAAYGALISAVLARRWRGDRARDVTVVFLAGISTAFLGAIASQDVFAATSEFFLRARPDGNGLNPTLLSDFFVIHPPMMFLAYALTNVPAAAALGHVVAGHGRWSTVAMQSSRIDWLLYTAAMGLGGIWAYYTLGFGGYWAWDPVEVANLLPWLALTLYLHAQLHHARHGRYAVVGPLLAMLPLLLTLFSTISTRSGLWISVCLLYTSPSPRDQRGSRMPSSA